MICDRCGKELIDNKVVSTCNLVKSATYQWFTYNLCSQCTYELVNFLGKKRSNMPKSLEFWYSNVEGSGTDV